ncbi:MAG: hypothetical protein WAU00_19450 [Caldilinea sp.]|nr:transposase family protein [Caldilinea sp.]
MSTKQKELIVDAATVVEKVVIPERAAKADVRSLYEVLARVPDRRKPCGKRCSSALVLTLLLLAKMSGESKLSGVAQWARLRIDWVQAHLLLERARLPSAYRQGQPVHLARRYRLLVQRATSTLAPRAHAKQVNQDHGRLTIRSLRTSCLVE